MEGRAKRVNSVYALFNMSEKESSCKNKKAADEAAFGQQVAVFLNNSMVKQQS